VREDGPPAWIAAQVVVMLIDGQFQARIVLPDGSDEWEDWFTWKEEGSDWRRARPAAQTRKERVQAEGASSQRHTKPPAGWTKLMDFGKLKGYRSPEGQLMKISLPAVWRIYEQRQEES